MNLNGTVAIAGFGDIYGEEGRDNLPTHLAAEAIIAATKDAGLTKADVTDQALLTGRSPFGEGRPQQWNSKLSSYLHLPTRVSTEITSHAAGANAMLKHAASLILSGVTEYVICVHADTPGLVRMLEEAPMEDTHVDFEQPFGPTMPALYAMIARRYMYEFGATSEQLAQVAVHAQNWAVHHPYAAKASKGQITAEDVLSSREIASPYRLWDCALWGPKFGTAGSFVVTSGERARDLTENPLYILGVGEAQVSETFSEQLESRANMPATLTTTSCAAAAAQAYEMAGISPNDVDVVGAGVNFTAMAPILLEDLGFAAKGEGLRLFDEGRTDVGGDLPFNTNGGWLSFGQAGVSCGMDTMIEVARQMRGEALGLQVPDCRLGIIQNQGGPLAYNTVTVLSTQPN
ncbi:thiolase family protein [Rhodococcus sp. NPDC127530]|uniref:thiolase family protein n=1 Tax=unclassified Rhodococcus (in: high G+C Gram-positive bacteria) TaxID=192944 RepID=UPI00364133B9